MDRTGLLVPVSAPAALAGAILELCDQPERRRVMADAALEKSAAEFSQQRIIDATLQAYEMGGATVGR